MTNNYPIYLKYAGVVKVISETSYIRVRVEGGEWSVEKLKDIPVTVEGAIKYGTPITAEEFKEVYQKAMSYIVHEAFMQSSETATPEEIEEEQYAAAQYEAEEFNL